MKNRHVAPRHWNKNPTPSSYPATIVQSYSDLQGAQQGSLYVVRSDAPTYFPTIALVEGGYAQTVGECFDGHGKIVTLQINKYGAQALQQRFTDNYFSNPEDPPQKHQISIGHSFFAASLRTYHDWRIKWWREAVQNAVDAGATTIDLGTIENSDGTVTVFAEDSGSGMSERTVHDKFLALGGSTKTLGSGALGGFGKAKELLILPWISWKIYSQNTLFDAANGAGAGYTTHPIEMRQGTRLEVVMPSDNCTTEANAIEFIEKCYLPNVQFTVNGKRIYANANAYEGELVEKFDKVNLYFVPKKDNDEQPYIYVRTGGVWMFSIYAAYVKGWLYAELTAPSIEVLTDNRDGCRDSTLDRNLSEVARRIAKDAEDVLKSKKGLIRQKFEGSGKFKARRKAAELLDQMGPYQPKLSTLDMDRIVSMAGSNSQMMLEQTYRGPSHLENALKQLIWEPDFYIMNDIEGFVVPPMFWPSTMTPTVLKLAKVWTELCRYVMIQLGSDKDFGVGWVFSDGWAAKGAAAVTSEGEERRGEEYFLVLNPLRNGNDRPPNKIGISDLLRPSRPADLKWMYAAAIHEATHIVDGELDHDRAFASAITRNMARCADGYRKIKHIVNGIKMSGGPELETEYDE